MIATVGTFDGVHRGHREVIAALIEEGAARHLLPLLITFSNHPLQVVAPERAPGLLQTPEEKLRELSGCDVCVSMLSFDPELCSLTAEQWMRRLRDEFGVRAMVVGYDNTFGCDGRSLRHEDFHRIGREAGVEILDAPVLPGISSSAVRKAIMAGDVIAAAGMLGRRYELSGEVVAGKQLGRKLGFPTANLLVDSRKLLPAEGVYAVTVSGAAADGSVLPGVVNIGRRPSLDDGDHLSVECHIAGFSGDLYGRRLTLGFVERLRGEEHFADLESLRRQITADAARAEAIFRIHSSEA